MIWQKVTWKHTQPISRAYVAAYNLLGKHEKGTLVTCLSELTDIGKKGWKSHSVFPETPSNISLCNKDLSGAHVTPT